MEFEELLERLERCVGQRTVNGGNHSCAETASYARQAVLSAYEALRGEVDAAKTTHCLACGHRPHPERLNCEVLTVWDCLEGQTKFYQSAEAECQRLRAEAEELRNQKAAADIHITQQDETILAQHPIITQLRAQRDKLVKLLQPIADVHSPNGKQECFCEVCEAIRRIKDSGL